MDQWHANFKPSFLPRSAENSFNFLFNYNFEPFSGMDVKQPEMVMSAAGGHHMVGAAAERGGGELEAGLCGGDQKKKRLTSEQLESLENSFQEEIKLDPDRKMKLSRDLGLQPRQVAVWFQNRRARWKAKQLERLYDSLKLEYDAVSREKHKLQHEVLKLRAMLMGQSTRNPNLNNNKQVSIGCTDISGGDETVESTSAAGGGRGSAQQTTGVVSPEQSIAECHYLFSAAAAVDDYNAVASPPPTYWPPLPSSYPC